MATPSAPKAAAAAAAAESSELLLLHPTNSSLTEPSIAEAGVVVVHTALDPTTTSPIVEADGAHDMAPTTKPTNSESPLRQAVSVVAEKIQSSPLHVHVAKPVSNSAAVVVPIAGSSVAEGDQYHAMPAAAAAAAAAAVGSTVAGPSDSGSRSLNGPASQVGKKRSVSPTAQLPTDKRAKTMPETTAAIAASVISGASERGVTMVGNAQSSVATVEPDDGATDRKQVIGAVVPTREAAGKSPAVVQTREPAGKSPAVAVGGKKTALKRPSGKQPASKQLGAGASGPTTSGKKPSAAKGLSKQTTTASGSGVNIVSSICSESDEMAMVQDSLVPGSARPDLALDELPDFPRKAPSQMVECYARLDQDTWRFRHLMSRETNSAFIRDFLKHTECNAAGVVEKKRAGRGALDGSADDDGTDTDDGAVVKSPPPQPKKRGRPPKNANASATLSYESLANSCMTAFSASRTSGPTLTGGFKSLLAADIEDGILRLVGYQSAAHKKTSKSAASALSAATLAVVGSFAANATAAAAAAALSKPAEASAASIAQVAAVAASGAAAAGVVSTAAQQPKHSQAQMEQESEDDLGVTETMTQACESMGTLLKGVFATAFVDDRSALLMFPALSFGLWRAMKRFLIQGVPLSGPWVRAVFQLLVYMWDEQHTEAGQGCFLELLQTAQWFVHDSERAPQWVPVGARNLATRFAFGDEMLEDGWIAQLLTYIAAHFSFVGKRCVPGIPLAAAGGGSSRADKKKSGTGAGLTTDCCSCTSIEPTQHPKFGKIPCTARSDHSQSAEYRPTGAIVDAVQRRVWHWTHAWRPLSEHARMELHQSTATIRPKPADKAGRAGKTVAARARTAEAAAAAIAEQATEAALAEATAQKKKRGYHPPSQRPPWLEAAADTQQDTEQHKTKAKGRSDKKTKHKSGGKKIDGAEEKVACVTLNAVDEPLRVPVRLALDHWANKRAI